MKEVLSNLENQEFQRQIISKLICSRLNRCEAISPKNSVITTGLSNERFTQTQAFFEDPRGMRVERELQPSAKTDSSNSSYRLSALGISNVHQVYRNLTVPELVEHSIMRGEGQLAANGALCVETGKYTGRSPRDRFIVDEPGTRHEVDWNTINRPISEEQFDRLYQRAVDYIQGQDLYLFDGYVGADVNYRFGVRVINELAWQNLFVHQLFRRPNSKELANHNADFTVIALPGLRGNPERDGLHSEAFIVLHLTRQIVLIGGTSYAGEMKSPYSLC